MYVYTQKNTHSTWLGNPEGHVYTHIPTYTYSHTNATETHTQKHIHRGTHTYTHTNPNTHTHTNTHIHPGAHAYRSTPGKKLSNSTVIRIYTCIMGGKENMLFQRFISNFENIFQISWQVERLTFVA